MGVNQLAKFLQITPDTVRYYTRIGYLIPRINPNNGYKEYDKALITRMRFIVSARKLGLHVQDIGRILKADEEGSRAAELFQELLDETLSEIDKKLKETSALRERVSAALLIWEKKPDSHPPCKQVYSLIEDLEYLDNR